MRWQNVRRDGDRARTRSIGHAAQPGATTSRADDTRTPRTTHGPVSSQQRAEDQAGDLPRADAERVAAERRFHVQLERELPAELRSRLHLTLSGTAATGDWRGRSFTLTHAGVVERTTITPSGGLSAYTVHAWCIAPADQQGVRNVAEGELQAGVLAYLGIHGSR